MNAILAQNICTNTGNALEDMFIVHPVAFVFVAVVAVIAIIVFFLFVL